MEGHNLTLIKGEEQLVISLLLEMTAKLSQNEKVIFIDNNDTFSGLEFTYEFPYAYLENIIVLKPLTKHQLWKELVGLSSGLKNNPKIIVTPFEFRNSKIFPFKVINRIIKLSKRFTVVVGITENSNLDLGLDRFSQISVKI